MITGEKNTKAYDLSHKASHSGRWFRPIYALLKTANFTPHHDLFPARDIERIFGSI
jgi:hypothetical protein